MNVDKLKHTPGPWFAQSRAMSDGALVIKDSEFNELCVIRESADRIYGSQNDTDMANSALIKAAPDLLAALQACANALSRYAHTDDSADCAAESARDAIAKARGE
jgi:hypothetical protein